MNYKNISGAFCLTVAALMLSTSVEARTDIGKHTKVGGYFDTEWHSTESSNTFKAHRFIMHLNSQIHERISVAAEIEYEYGAAINALDDTGEIKIEQAYMDYKINDAAIFRGGIVLSPMGLVNRYHDSDMRDTTNRPIFAKYIIPTTWMDTGLGFHGEADLNEDWALNYEAYIINGLQETVGTGIISDANGIRKIRPGFKADNNKDSAFVTRVGISPGVDFEFGTSYYTGVYSDDGADNLTILGFDFQYDIGAIELLGEYATVDIEGAAISEMNGYYIEARQHFFPDFLKNTFLDDGFDHPTFTAFARIGGVDTDTSTTTAQDRHQYTVGLNYRPIESTVFKFEYEINSERVTETENDAIIASVAVSF